MKPRAVMAMTLLCGMLAGCSAPPPENKPQSDTAVCGDFTLTLSAKKSVYQASELEPGNLLDFMVSYTYTGGQSEIEVWHGNRIYAVSLFTSKGECLLDSVIGSVLASSTLIRDKAYTESYDGATVYEHLGSFKPGDYKAVAWMRLSTDQKQTQTVECEAEIPFTIY